MTLNQIPTTYEGAAAFLGAKSARPIGHATCLSRISPDTIDLIYRNTAIVRYADYHTNALQLQTDGWRTSTTKERINYALGNRGRVYAYHGRWYYHKLPLKENERVLFTEGMVVE